MGNGESESTPKKHYWGKRIIISLVIIIGIVFAWHFYLSFDLSKRLESLNMHAIEQNSGLFVSTNYFTNHVNMTIKLPPNEGKFSSEEISSVADSVYGALTEGLKAITPELSARAEETLNTQAREKFDLYAMMVPYRVHASVEQADPGGNSKIQEEPVASKSASRPAPDISGLKKLTQNMKYSEARKIILDAGWQGKKTRWQDLEEYGQAKTLYYDNGWHEVQSCAPTGTSPCRFEFNDIHENTLVVITEGECYTENEGQKCDLGISRWLLE